MRVKQPRMPQAVTFHQFGLHHRTVRQGALQHSADACRIELNSTRIDCHRPHRITKASTNIVGETRSHHQHLPLRRPGVDGIEVCQRIRERSNVPIIMLTAKGEDMDKILGLEYGADDYMTKPFNILEVKARIKSIFRRSAPQAEVEEKRIVRVHDLEVNCQNRTVTLDGKAVRLTAKEFDLLQLFITHRGKVYNRESLLETVWKYDYMGDMRTVDVHIRRLREKIERDTSSPEFILTKWGVGYYFTDKD